jgi:hypothetical protein
MTVHKLKNFKEIEKENKEVCSYAATCTRTALLTVLISMSLNERRGLQVWKFPNTEGAGLAVRLLTGVWVVFWLSSVPPYRCWDITSITSRPLHSKSSPIYHPFNICHSTLHFRRWDRRKESIDAPDYAISFVSPTRPKYISSEHIYNR